MADCTPRNFEESLASKPFVFVVGEEMKEFHIHRQIVGRLSPALNILVNGTMREAREGRVEWPDVRTDTFVRFASYSYSGDYQEAEPEPLLEKDVTSGANQGMETQAAELEIGLSETRTPTEAIQPSAVANSEAPHSSHQPPNNHIVVDLTNPNANSDSDNISDSMTEDSELDSPDEEDYDSDSMGLVDLYDEDDQDADEHEGLPVISVSMGHPNVSTTMARARGKRQREDDEDDEDMNLPHILPYSLQAYVDRHFLYRERVRRNHLRRHHYPSSPEPPMKRCRHVGHELYDYDYEDYDDDDSESYDSNDSSMSSESERLYRERRRRHIKLERRRHELRNGALEHPSSENESHCSAEAVNCTYNGPPNPKADAIQDFHFLSRTFTSPVVRQDSVRWTPRLPLANDHAGTSTGGSSLESYEAVFLSHANLYVLADKYGIEDLRELSLSRLHRNLLCFEIHLDRVGDLVSLTDSLFDNTMEGDKARSMMVSFWVCIIEHVNSLPDIKDLLRKQGDFAASLVERMATRVR